MRQRSRVTRTTASVAATAMLAAGLIALAPQAANAASGSQSFNTSGGLSQQWVVPADVHSLKISAKGAAGGAGGVEGGSGGRGASGTALVPVTPGQTVTINLGKRGADADPDLNSGFGAAGNSAAAGKGGAGGVGGTGAGAGGGGGGATAVLLDGDLVLTAGAGGGGGGTGGGSFNVAAGNGGGADQDGDDGSAPATEGGQAGDAASEIGGTGDAGTSNGGGAGGGGGGHQGGSQGAATSTGGGGGGGGGTSYVNELLADLDGAWASTVDGDGAVSISYASQFATSIEIDDPNVVVTGQDKAYKVTVSAAGTGQVPTGSVELTAENTATGTVTAIGTKNLAAGKASFAQDGLLVGSYTLRASYTPDGASDSLASTADRDFAVVKGDSRIVVSGPATPPSLGDSVDLGVTVSAVAPAEGTPSGVVKFFQGGVAIPGGTANLDGSGQATLSTTKLTSGTAGITAEYQGDAQFNLSLDEDSLGGFVVNAGDLSVTLSAEHGTVIAGEQSKFVVDVASLNDSSTTPAGSVQLYADAVAIGAPETIDASGRANFMLTLPVTSTDGHHHIRAVFTSADTNYAGATSNWIDHFVNAGEAEIALSSDLNPSQVGNAVTFSIDVNGLIPTQPIEPTGQVQLYVGGTPRNAPIAIDADGQATVAIADLPVGTTSVYVRYLGDAKYKPATSEALQQVVAKRTPTASTTTIADPGVVVTGQSTSYQITVAPTAAGPVPTGSVELTAESADGVITVLGSKTLTAGSATINKSGLLAGTYTLLATYLPDAASDVSPSTGEFELTVTKGDTTTAVSGPASSPSAGSPVDLGVTVKAVAPAKGTPSGQVQLYQAGAAISDGIVTLDAAGKAVLTTTRLSFDTDTITAEYLGDSEFNASTGAASLGFVSTTTIDDPNTVVTGQTKGYKVTVSAAGTPQAPSGTIELTAENLADGTVIALGTKKLAAGTTTIYQDGLLVGDYTLHASYSPDGNTDALPSSADRDFSVIKGDSTTLIAGPLDPPNFGDPVDLGVSVTAVAPAKGIPSGQVKFYRDGTAIPGGTVTLDGAGQAVLTTTRLTVGESDISAEYLGDSEFEISVDSESLIGFVVNAGDVSVTLDDEHDTVIAGEKSKFVVDVASLTGSSVKPTGSVQLYVDDEVLGAPQIINPNTGRTTFQLELPVTNPNGHHHIRAVFTSATDSYNDATSNWIDHVVNFGDAKVALSSDVNPSSVGSDVTFSIDVDGLTPTKPYEPTGDVQLYVNGTAFNAPVAIDADGKATVTTDALPVGTVDVYAQYLGDTKYRPASSGVLQQVVKKQSVSVALVASPTELQFGELLTLTATVDPALTDTKVPGFVQFYDHGVAVGTPALLDASGRATISSNKTSRGVHQYSARYLGDDETVEGVSPTVTVKIRNNTLSFTLITNRVPAFQGEDILLHALLEADAGSKGKIAGTVQYYTNGKKYGAAVPVNGLNWGSMVVRKLKPGKHRFTARFTPSADSPFDTTTGAGVIQRVLKGKPNARVHVKAKRTGTTTAKIQVKVRSKAGRAATGHVQIYVDGRPVKLLKLSGSGKYRTYTLTGLRDHRAFVTASYRPDGQLRQASGALTVRKY